jgi:hypothetical protein
VVALDPAGVGEQVAGLYLDGGAGVGDHELLELGPHGLVQ